MSDTTKRIVKPAQIILDQVRKNANMKEFQLFVAKIRDLCIQFLREGVPLGTWQIVLTAKLSPELDTLRDEVNSLEGALIAAKLPHERIILLLKSYVRSLEGAIEFISLEAMAAPPGTLAFRIERSVKSILNGNAAVTLDTEYAHEIQEIKARL